MTKATYLPAKTETKTVVLEPEKVVLELTLEQAKIIKLFVGRTRGSQFGMYELYKELDNLRVLNCRTGAELNVPHTNLSEITL
jgi:hypothetical protein